MSPDPARPDRTLDPEARVRSEGDGPARPEGAEPGGRSPIESPRASSDASSQVPRGVRAFLRLVALYFICTGALGLLGGGAVALGLVDPTIVLDDPGFAGAGADLGETVARLARIPTVVGGLSLACGLALYAASRRLAARIAS